MPALNPLPTPFLYLPRLMALAIGYFLLGMLVLIPDHGAHAVTPVWPPSGLAIFALLQFGLRLWPGIALGIFLLAYANGMPWSVAVAAATGSVLETVVPVILLSRFREFNSGLYRIGDVIKFVALAGILGPVFSSALGSYAMTMAAGHTFDTSSLNVTLMWWLGNSLGSVVFGSFLLVWHHALTRPGRPDPGPVVLVSLSGAAVGFLATWLLSGTLSLIAINLLIPVVVYSAMRTGLSGVTATSLLTSLVVLFAPDAQGSANILPDSGINIGVVCLMVVWTNALIGLAVAAAYGESHAGQAFEFQATHDPLTGMYNRTGFTARLEQAAANAKREHRQHTLLYLDIDHFKTLNDTQGHATGDAILMDFARRIQSVVRKEDTPARIGGDAFAILLENCGQAQGTNFANQVRDLISARSFMHGNDTYPVTTSIGLVVIDRSSRGPEQVIMEADTACLQAKHAGRNRVAVYAQADTTR